MTKEQRSDLKAIAKMEKLVAKLHELHEGMSDYAKGTNDQDEHPWFSSLAGFQQSLGTAKTILEERAKNIPIPTVN